MKLKRKLSGLSILVILLMLSGSIYAQNGRRGSKRGSGNQGMMMQQQQRPLASMLDLTDDQQADLAKIRASHQEGMLYAKNQLAEKTAHLKTLLSAPERDSKAVDATIDEITSMKADLLKKQISNRDEFNTVLTPDQQQKMTAVKQRMGPQNQRGMRQGGEFSRGFNSKGMRSGNQRGFHGKGFDRPFNKRSGFDSGS